MNAFEQVVSDILRMEGYWVHNSVKVEITKEEKRKIGRHSSPRWELDVVAYSGSDNILRIVECKSYLDSPGVRLRGVDGSDPKEAKRYKLFADPTLYDVISNRLKIQFVKSGTCPSDARIKLCLACGRIVSESDRIGLHTLFREKKWDLWDEHWLRDRLEKMAEPDFGYEDQITAIVAKLLLRRKSKQ
jgi:hypothetical protein